MKDLVIIGRGPAGISAALYAKRAGLDTVIIANGGGSLEKAEKVENYYGIKSISGKRLLKKGLEQAAFLEIPVFDDEIVGIDWDGNFTVQGIKETHLAKSVIIATGTARNKGKIKGLEKFEGAGVSYCASCDGFFYRKKTVAVLGHSQFALHELNYLKDLAEKVFVLTNGLEPDTLFPENAIVMKQRISALEGGEKLESVIFEDGTEVKIDGLFVALGFASADSLARKIGAKSENGRIATDENKATNIPGLFAAGDCTGGLLQISKAVSDGAIAATSAISFVKSMKN